MIGIPSAQRKALFVVSQTGQMRRADELARLLSLQNAEVAILYTKKNPQMAISTESIADPEIFKTVTKVEIHAASNALNLYAARSARKAYRKLLRTVRPDEVFVCSFERHYAVLCHEVKSIGANLTLFEEGTAIYKNAIDGFSTFDEPTLSSAAKNIYNRVWKNQPITKYIIAPVVICTHQMLILPKLVALTFWELYKLPHLQKLLLTRSHKHFLSGWNRFDSIYASNPSALKRHFIAEQYIEALPSFDGAEFIEGAKDVAVQYQIDENTAIFASQSFPVDPALMISAVVHLLHQVADQTGLRIVVKLHPREKPANIKAYQSTLHALRLENKISLMEGVSVPAEYLAIYSACPAVVSISSSTLMYAPKHKQLRSISIGDALIDLLEHSGAKGLGVQQIKDHVRILEPISYIEQFKKLA